MSAAPLVTEWRNLPVTLTELCIETVLRCGQAFRWRRLNDEWHCALQGRIVSLKQDPTHLHYRVTWPKRRPTPAPRSQAFVSPLTPPSSVNSGCPSPARPVGALLPSVTSHRRDDMSSVHAPDGDDTASLLHQYFALHHSLTALYARWSAADANFARRASSFAGVRILNQDAWETLVAFICSSNNNIARISQMVSRLCESFGPYIGSVDGEAFHDFPGPKTLAVPGVESKLRDLGFGYRAKYIAETARIVAKCKPSAWLLELRSLESPALDGSPSPTASDVADQTPPTYRAAHEALLGLSGVGPKVADCVCLMGLGWGEAVPVDTHVWQIAQRDYGLGALGGGKGKQPTKTITKTMYDSIGGHFRHIWGAQAGWAQSVLFTANLASFSEQALASSGASKPAPSKRKRASAGVSRDSGTPVKAEEGHVDDVHVEGIVGDSIRLSVRNRTSTVKVEALALDEELCGEQAIKVKTAATRMSKRRKTRV